MIEVRYFQCEICKTIYSSETEATECEKKGRPVADLGPGDKIIYIAHWNSVVYQGYFVDQMINKSVHDLVVLVSGIQEVSPKFSGYEVPTEPAWIHYECIVGKKIKPLVIKNEEV